MVSAREAITDSTTAVGRSWRKLLVPGCILIGITMAAFLPALNNQFIDFDDDLYVTANPHVRAGLTRESLAWAFRSTQANNWHPLTWISHILDWQLFGSHPWGHHLTSVVFHATNAMLLLLVVYQLSGAPWRSFFVAGLFAVHPLRVESVAWVAERKDVLSTCFGLLAIWTYTKYAQEKASARIGAKRAQHSRTVVYYVLAFVCFVFSLMSKPMLVTLPFLLLLLDYWPLGRLETSSENLPRVPFWLLDKIPFLIGSAVSSWITFVAQRAGGAMTSLAHLTFGERLANVVVSYCRYLAKALVPTKLAVFYPHPGQWPTPIVLGCAILLVTITLIVVILRKRFPYAFVGWFWFVGSLVPVVGLVQIGRQGMADRYTYFPMIGIGLLAIWSLHTMTRPWPGGQIAVVTLGVVTLGTCVALTRYQLAYWKDSESLLSHAIAVTRNNYLAQNNLGIALQRQGRLKEAASAFREAIVAKPDDAEAHINLGNNLCRTGQIDSGIAEFECAIQFRSDSVQAHHNLGLALFNRGKFDEGIRELETTVKLRPDAAEAHVELARALTYRGRGDEAIRHLEEALRLSPEHRQAKQLLDSLRTASRR
jgi:Tfp pilus assembly protein PilF